MRQRLLYVIKHCDRSGAPLHVLALAREFRKEYEVALAYGSPGFLSRAFAALGARQMVHKSLGMRLTPIRMLRAIAEALKILRTSRYDLVHVHGPGASIIWRMAAALAGVPCVVTVHGWNFDRGLPLIRRISALLPEYLLRPLSRYVITVSEADRQLALRLKCLPSKNMRTIHNGIPDVTGLRQETNSKVVRVIMVARLSEQKDHPTLLRALACLNQFDWTLNMVGSGECEATLRRLVDDLNLRDRVRFSGECDDIDVQLAQADLFVLSSRYEGLPLSVLEAMRASLPVIASDVGGVSEAVRHEFSGLIVPPADVMALVTALKRLIKNASLRKQMGDNGRMVFVKSFQDSRMLTQTADVYVRAIARQPLGGNFAMDQS